MIDRKKKTVKQLQAECRKRKVGFMMNWTKAALVKRLEDEDNREEGMLELKKQLDKDRDDKDIELAKLKKQLATSQKKSNTLRNAAENVPGQMLVRAQANLDKEKKIFSDLEKRLDDVRIEKSKLSDEWVISKRKIAELETLVKSLK
tara:strand:- start:355 stop:795 length:441 start_codon:yes stop_codon:yes gene_type:complete